MIRAQKNVVHARRTHLADSTLDRDAADAVILRPQVRVDVVERGRNRAQRRHGGRRVEVLLIEVRIGDEVGCLLRPALAANGGEDIGGRKTVIEDAPAAAHHEVRPALGSLPHGPGKANARRGVYMIRDA